MATPIIQPDDSPFATMSPLSALAQINIAIAKAETGQRYKIGDREVSRGDLEWMYKERTRLELRVLKMNRGGIRARRVIPL